MTDSLFSPHWYRVAGLKPRLRDHVRLHRHVYRGRLWYILDNRAGECQHRFTPEVYQIIALMDGKRSIGRIWGSLNEHFGDSAPTQDQVIHLLAQLHGADALQCDIPPDSVELFQRYCRHRENQWKRRMASPFSIRIPLWDPDRFLTRWLPVVRPIFSWGAACLWLTFVTAMGIAAAIHWIDLSAAGGERILAPQNLLMIWLTYPILKTLHEFGHGFAAKYWGGEVHEMGILFLVFVPVPYVDASSSSAFSDKRKRMAVGAAGMLIELFLAALALLVWLNAEPGMVRDIAFNVMLIGGVSTLFFNGNPLLRFDGYYILADAIEIQNLSARSVKYYGYLIQRYLFGVKQAQSPANASGERGWFLFYGLAAFIYRLGIAVTIILFVAGKYFTIGVILAVWAAFSMLVMPIIKAINFVLSNPRIQRQRSRAHATVALLGSGTAALIFFAPVPQYTITEGVIWLPEDSIVRAGSDGFIQKVIAAPNTWVQRSSLLITSDDPLLPTQTKLLALQNQELQARYAWERISDRVQAGITQQEIATVQAKLTRAGEREDGLIIRSPADGIFVVPNFRDLPGRFVRQGDILAYVLDQSSMTVRVIVPQSRVGLARERTENVTVRLADRLAEPLDATIKRKIPAATNRLPSKALGTLGGGPIAVDAKDAEGLTTLRKFFQFDLSLSANRPLLYPGGRVYVRFDHGQETLAKQAYRAIRQVFLRRFRY